MAEVTELYNCSQSALYSGSRQLWTSVTEELLQFTSFKGKYTAPFVTARLLEIDTAEALPDEQQRNAAIEILRIQLKALWIIGRDQWQILKRYIADAYPEAEQKARLEEAGWLNYEAASDLNWDKCRALLLAGRTFITNHTAELTANNNMPAPFPAAYSLAMTNYNTKMGIFINARDNKPQATQAKLIANNLSYNEASGGCLDGQQIFKNDQAKKDQFVWDSIMLLINGPGVAGLRGFVKNLTNNQPITTATVTILNTTHTETTDEDGRYVITQVAAATYIVRYEAPGFEPLELSIEIETGHLTSKTVLLTPSA